MNTLDITEAIESAEVGYWEAFHEGDPKSMHELLVAALTAALPSLCEAIAQAIEARATMTSRALGHVTNPAFAAGLDTAASLVRGLAETKENE